ncbi:Nodule Cysteine-Rich (NCR) secreted peptide [Medicago truncatula]|uniref:Nodule Cysteine-Rich (NCR) secreted peptide n=2 Tax=Medicago truncatula TaxID=3880 RepID=A0A072TDM7_MEDTR|nr:Nodule Cysteine-Rich (NCR) secreted peptide [Medicago truncatula]
MTEIIKFVNVMIILLSVFIIAMNVNASPVLCQRNYECYEQICLPPKKHWCNILELVRINGFYLGLCACI